MENPEDDPFGDPVPEKKDSPVAFIGALVLLALVAVGAGWFTAGMLQPSEKAVTQEPVVAVKKNAKDDEEARKKEQEEAEKEEAAADKSDVIVMEPIIVALHKSDDTFMRIELAIIPRKGADISGAEDLMRIGSDIAAFTKTLTLQQISGPMGHLHFREDILDRARLVTNGQVKDLLVLSMVAE